MSIAPQCPSAALEAFVARGCAPAGGRQLAAAAAEAQCQYLQDCLDLAPKIVANLRSIADDAARDLLSQPLAAEDHGEAHDAAVLQELGMMALDTAAAAAAAAAAAGSAGQPSRLSATGARMTAVAGSAAARAAQPETQVAAAACRPVGWCDEDIALAMAEVATMAGREMDLMAAIYSDVHADTPSVELCTYEALWRLQPYMDEDLLDAVSLPPPAV